MNTEELRAYRREQYVTHRESRLAAASAYYTEHKQHILKRMKTDYDTNKEKYIQKGINYRHTPEGKDIVNRHTKQWREANPEKTKAQRKVNYKVSSGQLPSAGTMVCDICQEALAHHWHHHNGYGPGHELDVIAVCRPCHYETHRPKEATE